MHYFITGGAGFIGSHLIKHLLLDTNSRILCVDKLTYAGHSQRLASVINHPRMQFVQVDICDAEAISQLIEHFAPQRIINLAAETHVDNSIAKPEHFLQTNVHGTQTLLQASLGYWKKLRPELAESFRFYQISTDEVFGGSQFDTPLADELAPYRPSSPYSASKAAADHLVNAWQRTYGLPTLISRSSNNYGPWQHPEKLIPAVIRRVLSGQPVALYGSGEQRRDWLHVSDHVAAIALIANNSEAGESYNICTETWVSNTALVKQIGDILEKLCNEKLIIEHIKDRPGHDFCYRCSAAKLRSSLGWRAKHTLNAALEATVKSYVENPERLELPKRGMPT